MSDLRKEFTVGDDKLLYILKVDANLCNIYNFEQNQIYIFIAYFKRRLRLLWCSVFGQLGFNAL